MSFEGVKSPPPMRKAAAPKAKPPSAKVNARANAVNGLFQVAAFGSTTMKWYADAAAYSIHGPKISEEIAKLADTNEGVANVVDYITQAGPYAGLITATLPLVTQLMANHKMIKPMGGAMSPEFLEAQVKTQMAEAVLEALEEQHDAEKQLAMAEQKIKNLEDTDI